MCGRVSSGRRSIPRARARRNSPRTCASSTTFGAGRSGTRESSPSSRRRRAFLGDNSGSSFMAQAVTERIQQIYRAESRRVFATLVRLLGDFDLAEEALHDAFRAALEQWPAEGVPANPRAWLVSTGRFKAIDGIRRNARFDALDDHAEHVEALAAEDNKREADEIE